MRRHPPTLLPLLACPALLAPPLLAQGPAPEQATPHGHTHTQDARPPIDLERFLTDRASDVRLELPSEEDAFVFAVFGDRTGGPPEGVEVLAQAVEEVNLVRPDLVMTVGDLVEGYNQRPQWLVQAAEYSGIMDRLRCPWFPVAGNHDVYWRGGEVPAGEHDSDYEAHFGPLWYAFRHKDCWFVALYSDEGDPLTGEKTFNKPEGQRMSPEQFAFLDETLTRARDARHVFLFLHHPRWHGGGYGDDWERVHERLVAAGNVSAVFAGHIHRMLYDGVRDGIEYFTLATVGGGQSGVAPRVGYLHHWNLVTVRADGIDVAAFPVGAAIDPRAVTHALADDAWTLSRSLRPRTVAMPALGPDGAVDGRYVLELENPAAHPIEVGLRMESADSRWRFLPDHGHLRLEPGASAELSFAALRLASPLDGSFRFPAVTCQADLLATDHRLSMPALAHEAPLDPSLLPLPPAPEAERALHFDGVDDCLRVAHEDVALPDGPFTLECWLSAERFGERVGLACKTESSEYGIFVNGGVPEMSVHLDRKYVTAKAPSALLEVGRWQHLAGVFDGAEVRLYVDGELAARAAGSGARTVRAVPLLVGADVDGEGNANSFFAGAIDELRLSSVARYEGERFTPARRHAADDDTLLLLHLDGVLGPWVADHSPHARHPRTVGGPEPVEVR